MQILIVNGVNLSHLGSREINLYGNLSFDEYLQQLRAQYPTLQLDFFQSDDAGQLATHIANAKAYAGIVLNAGAYTHESIVLADAVRATSCPVIEVHITNLFGRENYRRHSVLTAHCAGFISGFGLDSYRLAIESIIEKIGTH